MQKSRAGALNNRFREKKIDCYAVFENSSRDTFDGFVSQDEEARKKKAAAAPAEAPKVYRSGVGKYIPNKPASRYHSFTKPIRCQLSQLIDKCFLGIGSEYFLKSP